MSKPDTRLAIYQPDIPQNLGAMMRLCACFGIAIDLIEPCGFPFSLKAIRRTAMDYMDLVKINCHNDFDSFMKEYKYKRRIILLTVKSSKSIWDFKFKSNDILMVGSESSGVSDGDRDSISLNIKIPILSSARCLNVTTAASIAVSEALRQNTK
tara:strand:- start:517 stop:978 length:462 start_codon:yes stop_codon:yes gene_type:complete